METLQLKIALAQYPSGSDIGRIVSEAQAAEAEIVVFPEMYSNGYAPFDPNDPAARTRWCAQAESLDGEFVGRFRQAAKAHRVQVVATFLEKAEPKPFIAALLIDADRRPLLHHRKVHICDLDSPELACRRGGGFAACDLETGAGPVRVGLMICMDREYPEAVCSLSRQGAEIVLVPKCCDLASDRAVDDVRIVQARGRAFETVIGIASPIILRPGARDTPSPSIPPAGSS
jgi:predicted amidohydrolase